MIFSEYDFIECIFLSTVKVHIKKIISQTKKCLRQETNVGRKLQAGKKICSRW